MTWKKSGTVLLAKQSGSPSITTGSRQGRIIVQVIRGKIYDRKDPATGLVVPVVKDEDFVKCEIEVEHLLSSTTAAASAEPVWREKIVMPVVQQWFLIPIPRPRLN